MDFDESLKTGSDRRQKTDLCRRAFNHENYGERRETPLLLTAFSYNGQSMRNSWHAARDRDEEREQEVNAYGYFAPKKFWHPGLNKRTTSVMNDVSQMRGLLPLFSSSFLWDTGWCQVIIRMNLVSLSLFCTERHLDDIQMMLTPWLIIDTDAKTFLASCTDSKLSSQSCLQFNPR